MKNSTKIILTTFSLVLLSGCEGSKPSAPSQNKALDAVSPTHKTAKKGAMQNSLDSWLKDEWTPTVEKDKKIQEKYMTKKKPKLVTNSDRNSTNKGYTENKERSFTLQEYVDKAAVYMDAQGQSSESNVEKLDTMPGIGKKKSRR